MGQFFLGLILFAYTAGVSLAQTGEVKNDTIYFLNDVNKPVEFSKAVGLYLYIKNIVPDDIPAKTRKISIISSNSNEIDTKTIQVINNKDIVIPIGLFTDKYYTLYIKKGSATIIAKKLIIR